MAFDANGFRQAAQQAGIPKQQIEQAIAQRTGVKGWLTGGKQGLGGFMSGVGNVLNLPSYALGGLLNQGQRAFKSQYGQETDATGLGILEGIKNKRGLMTEAPETLGIDPNSTAGKVLGFGAELLVPMPPVGKALKFARGADKVSDASKVGLFARGSQKAGGVTKEMARTLLEKSYKLSASDINKIAESIGVTDEATKAIKVIDYLEGLGLKGANRGSLKTLNKVTDKTQKSFNKVARTGGQVSRQPYIQNILDEAVRQEALNTPTSLGLSKRLFEEAYRQEKLGNKALTDTGLTNTISQLWSDVAESGISDPRTQSLSKSLAKSGSDAREVLRPGSQKLGRDLRGLRTAQDVLGKKANTGLGTQLINTMKPNAAGFGIGAVGGYSTGQNPLLAGVVGMAGGAIMNRPGTMNFLGKTLQKGVQIPKVTNPALRIGMNVAGQVARRTPVTALRTQAMPTQRIGNQQSLPIQNKVKVPTYKDIVPQGSGINYNPYKKVKPIWSK